MNRNKIIRFLGDDWRDVIKLMSNALHTDVGLLESINDTVMCHSGKLLRPIVCLLMARSLGKTTPDSIRYAAACELLHNATLMHDDVADVSPERRGIPTLQSTIGPSAAVLVGDFWLAKAVELVLESSNHDRISTAFSKTLTNLAEGEMFQLEKAGTADTSEEDYFRIIYGKTASLFEVASIAGAISVGADDRFVESAREYGRALGLAFQIMDDILDYAGTAKMGKPLGVDLREQKITLPLLCAMKGSLREQEIRTLVRNVRNTPDNAREVVAFVAERGGVEMAVGRLDEYIERAVSAMSVFPDSREKEELIEIARYNAFRRK